MMVLQQSFSRKFPVVALAVFLTCCFPGHGVFANDIDICRDYSLDFALYPRGTYVTDQFAHTMGVTLVCDSKKTDNGCRLFDTVKPVGEWTGLYNEEVGGPCDCVMPKCTKKQQNKCGDFDLGSPNVECGGVGQGEGGIPGAEFENCNALGHAVILDENGPAYAPDDNRRGGTIKFQFARPADTKQICFLDVDNMQKNMVVVKFDGDNDTEPVVKLPIPSLGNNGAGCLALPYTNVQQVKVSFKASGAVTSLDYSLCDTCEAPLDTFSTSMLLQVEAAPGLIPESEILQLQDLLRDAYNSIAGCDDEGAFINIHKVTIDIDGAPGFGDGSNPEGSEPLALYTWLATFEGTCRGCPSTAALLRESEDPTDDPPGCFCDFPTTDAYILAGNEALVKSGIISIYSIVDVTSLDSSTTPSPNAPPTGSPTPSPNAPPTGSPTPSPSAPPTGSPTISPNAPPTGSPTISPTGRPTSTPTPGPPVCIDFDCGDGYLLREDPETRVGEDRATCCYREGVCAGAPIGSPCSLGDIDSSLIPNPSFEEFTSCPTFHSQLDRAVTWVQATGATSDYWVGAPTCPDTWRQGFGGIGAMPQEATDGNAFVGSIKLSGGGYYEYIGACLSSPLLTGVDYTFNLDVAAATDSGNYGGDTNGITELLCIPDCNLFQIGGSGYMGSFFEVLATAAPDGGLIGGGDWKSITFEVTPTQDCPAIMFGPGLEQTTQSGQSGNYVIYDFLNLQEGEAGVCTESGECVPV